MLYIRVDMNQEIGTGNLMRCLSISEAARTVGVETTFLLADDEAEALLSEKRCRFIVLHTDWRDMEGELDALLPILAAEGAKRLLIDSYQVTEAYLRRLREKVETVYLDDLNRFVYPVDALICYAVYWKKFRYEERYPNTTRLYLGTRYAPLRQEFSGLGEKAIRERIVRVLVLSGGTDAYGAAEQITEALESVDRLEADIVCGEYSGSYERLVERYRGQSRIRIHRTSNHMANLMKDADLAISAGGTTLYELCACGVPTISYILADNQTENVAQFQRDGVMDCAGDIRKEPIGKNLVRLVEKYGAQAFRAERSDLARSIVDGVGAARIVDNLMKFDAAKSRDGGIL